MSDFLLIFRINGAGGAKPSDEQVRERKEWFGNIASSGRLADKGNTLSPISAKVITSPGAVTDGAYKQNNEFVSGYMVIKAEDIDEAISLAEKNPIFKIGGSIEVREVVTFISGN